MAVMNIFADLVYFILKANRIKKHFTYYLGVRKLLKSFFFVSFLFDHVYGGSCCQPVSFQHILRSS